MKWIFPSQPFFQSNGFINIKSEYKKVSIGVDVCGCVSYISATELHNIHDITSDKTEVNPRCDNLTDMYCSLT